MGVGDGDVVWGGGGGDVHQLITNKVSGFY